MTTYEEPWGHEGIDADNAIEYTQDEYAEYEREYPVLPTHKCQRGYSCPEGCDAEPIDMYEPR